MESKQCIKCSEVKEEKEFTKTIKRNKLKNGKVGVYVSISKRCKLCNKEIRKERYSKSNYQKQSKEDFITIDNMIKFANNLGFKSASYAMDKLGKEQFKKMYYENIRTNYKLEC